MKLFIVCIAAQQPILSLLRSAFLPTTVMFLCYISSVFWFNVLSFCRCKISLCLGVDTGGRSSAICASASVRPMLMYEFGQLKKRELLSICQHFCWSTLHIEFRMVSIGSAFLDLSHSLGAVIYMRKGESNLQVQMNLCSILRWPYIQFVPCFDYV